MGPVTCHNRKKVLASVIMPFEEKTIDKLTSDNYSVWKFKLKHLLIAKELYGYVDGTITLAGDANATVKADFAKKSSKAFSHIVLSVSDNLLYLITEAENPKEAWDKLKAHFERDTRGVSSMRAGWAEPYQF